MRRSESGNRVIDGVFCPKCGGQVVYNGNYFCEYFITAGGTCEWALSHGPNGKPVGKRDKAVWEQIQARTR